ncbi:MAG: ATP-binding cassette domain-containing protein [Acutalibacteraceae bacterium]|nr:ATP-binding cassette domain-containing protein [Acutalibacteraceae bacterium]
MFHIKNLSIADNIVFPAFQLGNRSRKAIVCDAENLMKKMGIISVADHNIRKVSGGQLQRAAICRAMINRPDILFGDEPTGALDSSSTKEVMDILEEINFGGTTILLVTHDAKVASRADRIIYLEDGKIKDEFRQKKGSESNIKEWLAKMGFNGIIFLWKNDFLMKTQ